MSGIVSCSFYLNLTVLRFIGLYPSRKFPKLHKVYGTLLFVLSMTPPLVLGILHFLFTEHLAELDYNDCLLVAIIIYVFKLWYFLKNTGDIKKCVEYLDDHFVVRSDHKSITEECVAACKRNTLCFLGGCIGGFVGVVGQVAVKGNMDNLPLNVWVPDVWKETRLLYCSIYFLLILGLLYITAAIGTIDPFIGGLSHHASAQLQILAHILQFIYQNENKHRTNEDFTSYEDNIYRKIKMCIQQYQHIVAFVHKYQECFSQVVFIQLVGNVLVIGFCCLQLLMMEVDINFFINVLGLCVVFFQIFFYCYYGALLIEKNDSLFRAAYMNKWYEYDEPSKKALLILMERLNKPLIVYVGKILSLSLDTFTMTLKRSYSLLAVLKNS